MDITNTSIVKRAFTGIILLVIILGLLLFISAGTFRFWQAWVYLFIFGVSSFLITLFLVSEDLELLKRRLNAGAGSERERNQRKIQAAARFVFIALMLVPGFDHRFRWSDIPFWLVIGGEIFVAMGFYMVFRVFRENTFASATIEIAENQKVISTGPYAIVRHPMYSGALLMLIFTPFALGSLWDLFVASLMVIVIVRRLLDEERFLAKNLEGYVAYRQITRFRLIPGIW